MIIAIIEFVTLCCHACMSHDDVGIIVQAQVHFVSGERTLEYRQLAVVIECVSGCVGSALLAFLREYTKQFFTLFCAQSMIVIYQAKYCTHISRPPLP